MKLSHRTKVRIVLTSGAVIATGGTIAVLLFPTAALALHVGSALTAFATNLVWIWEEV